MGSGEVKEIKPGVCRIVLDISGSKLNNDYLFGHDLQYAVTQFRVTQLLY